MYQCKKCSSLFHLDRMALDGLCDSCWKHDKKIPKDPEPGSVWDLLLSAAMKKEAEPYYTFCLRGDLCQMGAQKAYLLSRGISVQMNDVYPMIRPEDVKRSMELIWNNRVNGWWHYTKDLAAAGIAESSFMEEQIQSGLNTQDIASNKLTPEFKEVKNQEMIPLRIERKMWFKKKEE